VKFAFIDRHRSVWPVCVQCRVLGVSATGYHQHRVRRTRIAQRRHQTDEALLVHIRAVHAETRGAYGWPRLWRELSQRGVLADCQARPVVFTGTLAAPAV
jgi:putative transposase